MATDENNHKNEARDDWTGCTFRVERGPSSEGRAWGMADILTDVSRRVWRRRRRAAPASHYSHRTRLIATDAGATTDSGTRARPRSPRARPDARSSGSAPRKRRPGRVRSRSRAPARPHVGRAGPRAPRPSGSGHGPLQGRHVPPALALLRLLKRSAIVRRYAPRVSFPLLPPALY